MKSTPQYMGVLKTLAASFRAYESRHLVRQTKERDFSQCDLTTEWVQCDQCKKWRVCSKKIVDSYGTELAFYCHSKDSPVMIRLLAAKVPVAQARRQSHEEAEDVMHADDTTKLIDMGAHAGGAHEGGAQSSTTTSASKPSSKTGGKKRAASIMKQPRSDSEPPSKHRRKSTGEVGAGKVGGAGGGVSGAGSSSGVGSSGTGSSGEHPEVASRAAVGSSKKETAKERVVRLGKSVQKFSTPGEEYDLAKALSKMKKLEGANITLEELKSTGVIEVIKDLKARKKPSSKLYDAAKQVLKKWKQRSW
jgi:hypothetical protein